MNWPKRGVHFENYQGELETDEKGIIAVRKAQSSPGSKTLREHSVSAAKTESGAF